jgi:hypothetical protein
MALFNYKEELKILASDKQTGIYVNKLILASETSDNQIDFSQLIVSDLSNDSFKYQFKQQKEVVPREKIRLDKIKKFEYIISELNMFYGIGLRESGQMDLYWDMTLVDSPADGKIIANSHTLYSYCIGHSFEL